MDVAQLREVGWGSRTGVYGFAWACDPSRKGAGPFDLTISNPGAAFSERGPDDVLWLAQPPFERDNLDELKTPWTAVQGLARSFGDLAPADDEPLQLDPVLAFANKYGWLSLPRYHGDFDRPAARAEASAEWSPNSQNWPRLCYGMDITVNDQPYWGEAVDAWLMEIHNMSLAIRWRDAVKNLDRRAFRRTDAERLPNVYWNRFLLQSYWELAPPGRVSPKLRARARADTPVDDQKDWTRGANARIERLINEKLRLHTSSTVRFEPEANEFVRDSAPHNLIGVMWSQLATEVSRNQDFGVCRNCREHFLRDDPSSDDARRKDARYCSKSCVEKASRKRARIAAHRGAGGTWTAIAQDMGLPVETVQQLHQEYVDNRKNKRSNRRNSKTKRKHPHEAKSKR